MKGILMKAQKQQNRFQLKIIVMLGLVLFGLSGQRLDASDEPAYFADENLKAAVKTALGISADPTATDMLGLISLVTPWDIYSLVGLEHAVNIEELYVYYSQISSLEPLAGLTNLEKLGLLSNKISNIEPLDELTKLTYLDLRNNQISNIEPLNGLTNLVELRLEHNQIVDIEPMNGLTNLNELRLSYNQISKLAPWDGLPNLTILDLAENQISNLKPLSGLTNLQVLGLEYNQISNLKPLSGLINLNFLGLCWNQISNIEPLARLYNLTDLPLCDNQITNIWPLVELTELSSLFLNNNPLDCEAYHYVIPQIIENNPDIGIEYDPMPAECEFLNQIEEILDFVNDRVEDGTLTGEGSGTSAENRLNAYINMLEEAQRLIDAEKFKDAYGQLRSAYRLTDGESPPPDFITGEAAPLLAAMIKYLMESLL
jgi:hypothetical protein